MIMGILVRFAIVTAMFFALSWLIHWAMKPSPASGTRAPDHGGGSGVGQQGQAASAVKEPLLVPEDDATPTPPEAGTAAASSDAATTAAVVLLADGGGEDVEEEALSV